ncbi:MAG: nitroreductase family protein [Lapillicoccus sp.]
MTDAVAPAEPFLAAIRNRRVTRAMSAEPLDRRLLETILDAARWAPTAGNRHLQRYVVSDHPGTLRALRMVSPGMVQRPAAVIAICVDRPLAAAYGFPPSATGPYVDVGTAAATILLAAQALGIGAGPVTSFSRAAVAVVLQLPDGWSPEMVVCLGRPSPDQPPPVRRRGRLTWRDLTTWVPDEGDGRYAARARPGD